MPERHQTIRSGVMLASVLVAVLVLAGGGCAERVRSGSDLPEFRQVHMGMEVRISINAARPLADSLAERAFARVAELEAVLSDWNPQSELRGLEGKAAGEWTVISAPLRAVMALALSMARETDGAFDPTVGALTALWRESVRTGQPIADTARRRALSTVGYEAVELDSAASRIRLHRAGTRLDLGAIAKGWILDQALLTISADEAAGVLIEAGGDIVTRGSPPSSDGWRIAVRTQAGDSMIVVHDAAVSTSSARAQLSSPSDSSSEGHIFRTRDGRGATDTPQLTVIGTRGTVTDALATALPLLPRDRWIALAARYGVRIIEGPPRDRR